MGHMIEEIALSRGHEIVCIIDVNNTEDFQSEAFRSAEVAIEFTSPTAAYGNYLRAFEAGVKAGAATLMSAFHTISGIPASANHYILTEVLKEKWQHDGFVVSDWGAIEISGHGRG